VSRPLPNVPPATITTKGTTKKPTTRAHL